MLITKIVDTYPNRVIRFAISRQYWWELFCVRVTSHLIKVIKGSNDDFCAVLKDYVLVKETFRFMYQDYLMVRTGFITIVKLLYKMKSKWYAWAKFCYQQGWLEVEKGTECPWNWPKLLK